MRGGERRATGRGSRRPQGPLFAGGDRRAERGRVLSHVPIAPPRGHGQGGEAVADRFHGRLCRTDVPLRVLRGGLSAPAPPALRQGDGCAR